jgi:sugar phosphate isomerase/epimerase
MRTRYSLAHLTVLSLSPPEVIDVAARAGYQCVGLRITRVTPNEKLYDLARDRQLMRETKACLGDSGIAVHDVELFRMDPSLEPETFVPELEATAELGARSIIAQLPDPNRDRAISRFARLCDLSKTLGIFVNLEFPHWTETGDLAEAARVVAAVNRNNAGILVDMLHFARSRSNIELLASLPREWFRFAHVCDAAKEVPAEMANVIRTARDERQFPGEGNIDLLGIVAKLPSDIPYALEIPRKMLTAVIGPEAVARLALQVSQHYFDEALRVERPSATATLNPSSAALAGAVNECEFGGAPSKSRVLRKRRM